MPQTLCDKYGFDKPGRERRLALLGFGVADLELAQQLQTRVLATNREAIIEAFHEFILSKPEMAAHVDGSEMLEHLGTINMCCHFRFAQDELMERFNNGFTIRRQHSGL